MEQDDFVPVPTGKQDDEDLVAATKRKEKSLYDEVTENPYVASVARVAGRAAEGFLPGYLHAVAAVDKGENLLRHHLFGEPEASFEDLDKRRLAWWNKEKKKAGSIEQMAGNTAELTGMVYSPFNKLFGGARAMKAAEGLSANAAKFISPVAEKVVGHTVATKVAPKALEYGLLGAGSGGVQATAQYLGNTPVSEITAKDTGEALSKGMKTGGLVGAGLGGTMGFLGRNRESNLIQAIGSTKSDVRMPGKANAALSSTQEIKEALKIAEGAEKLGLIGKPGQTLADTLEAAAKMSSQVGKEGEQVRVALAQAAKQTGQPTIAPAKDVVDDVMKTLEAEFGTKNPTTIENGIATARVELRKVLMDRGSKGRLVTTTPVGLSEVHEAIQKLKPVIRGLRNTGDAAASSTSYVLTHVERRLRNIFRENAKAIDPDLARKLEEIDGKYHISQTVEDMVASGRIGELGSRGSGLLGSVRGILGTMVGQLLGPKAALVGRALSSKMSQRGVEGNTLLWLARQGPKIQKTSGVAGAYAGKPKTSQTGR